MHTIARFWDGIQKSLFPLLREELGPLTGEEERIAAILEMLRIEEHVPYLPLLRGRPLSDRRAIARAFVAKMVLGIPITRHLISRLKGSPSLRRLCGWEHRSQIPSESGFSRAFAWFARTDLPARVHERLIERFQKPHIIGHISRDGTAIKAREKAAPKEKPPVVTRPPRKRGRPKKGEVRPPHEPQTRLTRQVAGTMTLDQMIADLPTACDWGRKQNSEGKIEQWKGYKLHIDWADTGVPITALLTSASTHDSQAAIPLAIRTAQRVTSLYDLMDSAYDAEPIHRHSRSLGHVPIIDQNPRRGEKVPRDPATARRYAERTTAERGNARLKDEFCGRTIYYRGATKVLAHCLFGLLALTADQLLRLAT